MNQKAKTNYTILSNCINNELLDHVKEYKIINDDLTFDSIKEIIRGSDFEKIIFNETLRRFSLDEISELLLLLQEKNICFINITSNIEETLFSDYTYVLDKNKVIMEGNTHDILKEEKLLKRFGFGLPFVVDLSTQLKYYKLLDQIYYDMDSLVSKLWN